MPSLLFTTIGLRDLTLANRIVVSPMCQYSADDGSATDWHMQHLGSLAVSGAGLLMVEATAVEQAGRITHGCLGLYSDANEVALGRVVAACRRYGNTALGIQLAHAGRKGSAHRPWEGIRPLSEEEGAWVTVAPSPIALDEDWPTPRALTAGARPCRGALRPWLSAARVPLADRQQARRRLWRQPREPDALPSARHGCDARGVAGEEAARRAYHRH
jgi:2,4-dienoyl-CoA reductase-like NADH-dependent reductase (Old Yellow Enzyme family)